MVEKSWWEEDRKRRLAEGMRECKKCGFVDQYKGQNGHYFTCPIVQERMRTQKSIDDYSDGGKSITDLMSENWAEE
jgi:hypothetical protein